MKLLPVPGHEGRTSTLMLYLAVIAAATALANLISLALGQLVMALSCMALLVQLRRSRRMQLALQGRIVAYREKAHALKEQARCDGLTGLANRLLLADRFKVAAARSRRSRRPFALLMIDLDAFKAVNDTHGHAAGDQVLMMVAKRLVGAVRASDTVARLGGDEFVLLIELFKDADEVVEIGRKLISTLSEPMTLDSGIEVRVGASVGVAIWPEHGRDMGDLLHVADKGMYDCKISGLMSLH